jgi:hypothetical protein
MGCFHFQSNELSVAVLLISHQFTLLPKWKQQPPVYAQLSSGDFWKWLAVILNGKALTGVPRWQLHCINGRNEMK